MFCMRPENSFTPKHCLLVHLLRRSNYFGNLRFYSDWLDDWAEGEEDRVTTRVRVDDYFPLRDDALRAHRTQVDPEGIWFAVPLEMQRDLWPTEDYHLAISHVATHVPESDLFAGIREG